MRGSSCRSAALLAAGALLLVLAVTPAAAKDLIFGGKVREVNARDHSFIMNGGSSKKYARVKVVVDRKTHWSGLPRKGGRVIVGDNLRATVAPQKDGSFRALAVDVQDPNARPIKAGATKSK